MRAFSCGPGGPELRLAADAPADVLTLLAAPPDDAYVVAYLKEELIYDRLGLAAGDDVLDAVPRLGGEDGSHAVEAVGTWLTPMPGGRVGGADRWRLPDPADRDVQVCPGVLPRSVAVYPRHRRRSSGASATRTPGRTVTRRSPC